MSYTRAVAAFWLLVLMALIAQSGRAEQTRATMTFVVHAPYAKSVAVIGNFNGWDGKQHLLVGPNAAGDWTGTFELVGEAVYFEFVFLVDDTRRLVDGRYPTIEDDFGGANNVVGAP